jgi:hypothetical protein
LDLKESDEIVHIKNKWFEDSTFRCGQQTKSTTARLSFESFAGLFIITGIVSGLMLVISICTFIFKERNNLQSIGDSESNISQKLLAWLKYYYQKDFASPAFNNSNELPQSGGGGAEENQNFTSVDNTTSSIELVDLSSPDSSTEDTHLASSQEGMLNPQVPIMSH